MLVERLGDDDAWFDRVLIFTCITCFSKSFFSHFLIFAYVR